MRDLATDLRSKNGGKMKYTLALSDHDIEVIELYLDGGDHIDREGLFRWIAQTLVDDWKEFNGEGNENEQMEMGLRP